MRKRQTEIKDFAETIIHFAMHERNEGTLEQRYAIYLDNTDDEFPLTFDEWLNS